MTTILAEEETLRRAVHSNDFAEAERLARLYTRSLETALPQLPQAQAESRLRDACKLMEWARRCLCAARARLNDELRRVQRLSIYRQPGSQETVHTWRIDG